MNKAKNLKRYYPIIVTAGLTGGIFCLLLWIRGFYPFGSDSLTVTDMHSQYIPLLYRFYDVVTGEKNLFYDFYVSGGINLYSETVNEICNPFNYLLLFWKRENIYLAVNILLLVYTSASACSAHFFLMKVWDKNSILNYALSLCYAFSGYFAYNYQILKWMIFPVIFPLFLLACLKLFKEKKGTVYAMLLGYQLILNIQLGFMTLLFTLFFAGLWMYCMEPKESRKEFCLNLGGYTIIGVLFSAIALLPNIAVLLSSARSGAGQTYAQIIRMDGFDDLFERIFQFFHPVLFGIGICLFMKNVVQHSLKELLKNSELKLIFLGNLFLWFTALFQPANLIWHMGSYVCFPVRYAYMLLLATICFIKILERNITEAAENSEKKRYIADLAVGLLMIAALVFAVYVLKENELEIDRAFRTLAISLQNKKAAIKAGIILVSILAASVLAASRRRIRVVGVAASVLVCSFCYFHMLTMPEEAGKRQQNMNEYHILTEEFENSAGEDINNLLNREKQNINFHRNAALVNGKSSLSGYFSTANNDYQNLMKNFGYTTPWVSTVDIGGTKISDYFFSHIFQLSAENCEIEESTDSLKNQKKLLEIMAKDSASAAYLDRVFQIVPAEGLSEDPSGNRVLWLEEKSIIYLDADILADQLELQVNGEKLEIENTNWYTEPNILICLGTFAPGEVSISLKDVEENKLSLENVKLGILNERLWSDLSEQMNSVYLTDHVEVISKGLKCQISIADEFSKDMLMIPFCAADGWTATIDGRKAEVSDIGNCLIGVKVSEGMHELELKFEPPLIRDGSLISLATFLILVIVGFVKANQGYEAVLKLGGVFTVLFTMILLGAVIIIYLVPVIVTVKRIII